MITMGKLMTEAMRYYRDRVPKVRGFPFAVALFPDLRPCGPRLEAPEAANQPQIASLVA